MEGKNYIIVDDLNRWHSTGKNATPNEIVDDCIEITKRLKSEGETDERILFVFETINEPIEVIVSPK